MLGRTVQTPLDSFLAELRQIEKKHRAAGPQRSHEDMLRGSLDCMAVMVRMLQSLGEPIPSSLNYTIDAMTRQLDPYFPHTAHLFIPPAKLAAKSEPTGWLAQVKKAMLTALVQVLHEDGLTVVESCQRVAAEVDRPGLHVEDGRARGRTASGSRLKEWRTDANAGKFKGEFPALYEKAKVYLTAGLARIKANFPADLVHVELIDRVFARVANHTVRVVGNDPL